MNMLITAGNTQTPVDRVRCITNIFSGRTGEAIALAATARGHRVTLITSREAGTPPHIRHRPYRTFDDLESAMRHELATAAYDVLIMAAAVNDYHVAGTYGLAEGVTFDPNALTVDGPFADVARGKVRGNHPELWLRLTPAPKLIDRARRDWGFAGTLVKFKLEVDVAEGDLLRIAEESRRQSAADWIVANSYRDRVGEAWILGAQSAAVKVTREELPFALLDRLAKSKG
jgi:phosphopantothenate-cysteine ligase/phosphopantothenoylcysteine decarboxylase/phosphopantothenate--cysteine ligase